MNKKGIFIGGSRKFGLILENIMTKLSQLNIELAQNFIDFNPDYTFFALKRQFFQFGALKVDIFFKNIGYNFNGMKIRVRSIQTPPLKKFKWVNILGG